MKWFKHMVDSGDDPDIGAIISRFGFDGYYMFFRTLEIMSREYDIENPGINSFNFQWFLGRFSRGISQKKLKNFLDFTKELGRIYYELDGDRIILNCPKLKDLTDEYTRQKPYRNQEKVTDKVTDEVTKKVTPKKKDIRSKNKDNTITTNVVIPQNGKNSGSEDPPKNTQKPKINFNFETGEWENIPEEDIERWKKTYPACDIQQELLEMADWLLNNPQKRKKNYRRFISGWLSREQERGGTRKQPIYSSYRDIEKAKLEAELRLGRNRAPVSIPESYLEKRAQKEQELWEQYKPKIQKGEISMAEAEGQIRTALAQWHNSQSFEQRNHA